MITHVNQVNTIASENDAHILHVCTEGNFLLGNNSVASFFLSFNYLMPLSTLKSVMQYFKLAINAMRW